MAGRAGRTSPSPRQVMMLVRLVVVGVVCFSLGRWTAPARLAGGGGGVPSASPAQQQAGEEEGLVPAMDRRCSAREREWQASVFPAARTRGCAHKDFPVLRLVHALMPFATVFLDVGSNKGYAAAEWFELWSPRLGISRRALREELAKRVPPDQFKALGFGDCGGCNECRDGVRPLLVRGLDRACTKAASTTTAASKAAELTSASHLLCATLGSRYEGNTANGRRIHVYSFDANPQMVTGLNLVLRSTMASRLRARSDNDEDEDDDNDNDSLLARFLPANASSVPLSALWTVENLALTHPRHPPTVTVTLNQGEFGRLTSVPYQSGVDDERSAIGTAWRPPKDQPESTQSGIPALTLDELVLLKRGAPSLPSRVDLLKIDAEGHDADVLRGATELLSQHRVTVVKFEYGALWSGKQDPPRLLRDVVTGLFEDAGYACYFEGKNGLTKLNRGCWSDSFETRFWSNVWCACLHTREGAAIAHALDGLSVAFW